MKKHYFGWMLAMMMVFGVSNVWAESLPDGVEAETWTLTGQYYATGSGFQNPEFVTQVAFDGEDVYLKGLSLNFPDAWIKGTLDPETHLVTFANSQVSGTKGTTEYYIIGTDDASTECDIVFRYDADRQMLTNQTMFIMEVTEHTEPINSYEVFWMSAVYYAGEPTEPEPVEVPDGLETAPWTLTANVLYGDPVTTEMRVGFDGQDVYFYGFTESYSGSGWAKGTLSDDGTTLTIKAPQYLGTISRSGYEYDCFLASVDDDGYLVDLVFQYDAEAGTFTTDQQVVLNSDMHRVSRLATLTDMVITRVNLEAATPVDPAILVFEGKEGYPNIQMDVQAVDVDGNELDESSFFYTLWIEKDGVEQQLTLSAELYTDDLEEDMVEIPYLFSGYEIYDQGQLVYLKQGLEEMETWTKIGVQSIYREGEKVGRSNIVWMDLTSYWDNVLVKLPEGVVPQQWAIDAIFNAEEGNIFDVQKATQVAFDGTDVYLQGLSYFFPDAWVKGTLDTETGLVTFASGQYVGEAEYYGKEYMLGSNGGTDICDIVFKYDEAAQTLIQETTFIYDNDGKESIDSWGAWMNTSYYAGELVVVEPTEATDGLETELYTLTATNGSDEYSYQMEIGFDGNAVYFKGFTEDTNNMWLKGTLSDDGKTVTIPANQYMGILQSIFYDYKLYMTAFDMSGGFVDIVMNYDAEAGTFTTDQVMVINSNRFVQKPLQSFSNVVITKTPEATGNPADPKITSFVHNVDYPYLKCEIPTVDVNGLPMRPDQLYYTIWFKKDGVEQQFTVLASEYESVNEDMVEIPYTYEDYNDIYKGASMFYLNPTTDDYASWSDVGIQSIYYGVEGRKTSNVVWLSGAVGIEDIIAAKDSRQGKTYDLSGRRVTTPVRGLYIRDGKKVLMK